MSRAQGQFTIIDYNDALTLTGYIGSNLAKTQMYNPDNGTYTCLPANTSRYGLTKLSNSVNSTSQALAATPYAVKLAYDRSSWNSITLTNALALAYGGTGATNAANARTNLGITCTSLYSGSLSGSSGITFNYGSYKAYIILGHPASGNSKVGLVVPKAVITTSDVRYQIADNDNYCSFYLRYSGSTATLTRYAGSGLITNVYGVN